MRPPAQLDLARAQTPSRRPASRNCGSRSPIPSSRPRSTAWSSKRAVDPGAFVSQNVPVVDVVDIGRVRLVANIVEKDLEALHTGNATLVQVDAYPGETFKGRIAACLAGARSDDAHGADRDRDPERRLPPEAGHVRASGHHDRHEEGRAGRADRTPSSIWAAGAACFSRRTTPPCSASCRSASSSRTSSKSLGGLTENETVITTGSAALRDGDRVVLPGRSEGRGDGAASARSGRRAAAKAVAAGSGAGGESTRQ